MKKAPIILLFSFSGLISYSLNAISMPERFQTNDRIEVSKPGRYIVVEKDRIENELDRSDLIALCEQLSAANSTQRVVTQELLGDASCSSYVDKFLAQKAQLNTP